ncbi:hypothetical protein ACIA5D_12725 [Actinoplanes sp. NPDC051513]|uniref:hypothetical protein n=1 Tax=Actinoplanes sp. NPDC051513 TaxID=3363908 RepID=UPI0037BBA00E
MTNLLLLFCDQLRAALVFGAEPGETGCYDNGYPMPADRPTLMGALSEAGYKFRDGGEDRRLLQLIQAYYLACVSFVDAQIARILAEVPADTVVVLSADHGEYNVYSRDPLLAMRERAAGHFPELAGAGFDTDTVPLALGGPDEAETFAAIARDPDGGFLAIPDDDLAPDETFAEYRTRYREGEKS